MNNLNQSRFNRAVPFEDFLASTVENADLWRMTAKRAVVDTETAARAVDLPGRWNILVIADDWCGDAVNTVPFIARLADLTPGWEMRVLGREADPELMDHHLTNGSRSIPVAILLDEKFTECGWWGPRPAELQEWVLGPGKEMPKDERYREVRRWYARDRGHTTLDELLTLMEKAAATCRAA